ncbi:Transitional endoplasmic reticulum ATPase domain protein [Babesia bovis T2Bo]|uniref:Cell division cycle protein ATPase, putative n=1 Tax=Babesia bovis TaxID=5865 RepID=A7AVE1_BABBO|nr:Transitional endoplasmic reticulum ATPase domain protein [Babesia bovis T2Bo]EDO05767.1 Transitional endoplasmic reticulum ATPase domain protein [Babesia bovis T2Bo]|eukprot:XP_001609335.1 cell division cycle protein ATPase [Babesia bovis T2Bo]
MPSYRNNLSRYFLLLYFLCLSSILALDVRSGPRQKVNLLPSSAPCHVSKYGTSSWSLALIPFGSGGNSGPDKDSKSVKEGFSGWPWSKKKDDLPSGGNPHSHEDSSEPTLPESDTVERISKGPSQRILEGLIPNLFVLSGVFDGNSSIEIRMGKEPANKLGVAEGNLVRVRGKKRCDTVCVVGIDPNITDNQVLIHSDTRRNLKLRTGDVMSIDLISDIPPAKLVKLMPFEDSVGPILAQMPQTLRHTFPKMLMKVILDFFSREIALGRRRPVRLGDHMTLQLKFQDSTKSSLVLLPNDHNETNSFVVELKIMSIKSYKDDYRGIMDVESGLISGESVLDCSGPSLTREQHDASYGELGYDEIGGMDKQLSKIRELIELPLLHPEVYKAVGISPPKGVILHGPPGTGKTLIARAIASETGAHCVVINGPEIMSKHVGESEAKLRRAFEKASKNSPAIIFIDEIDSIATKREKSPSELERRIVSQLLTLMDGIEPSKNVVVLAATNRINSIDTALRRFGRFDREIEIAACDEEERYEILKIKTRGMRLSPDISLKKIAGECHGYVGADIAQLCFEAAMCCIRENLASMDMLQFEDKVSPEVLNKLVIQNRHFAEALRICNPSTLRERRVQIPETTWEDIGGLEDVKKELIETVQYPVEHPEKFRKFGQASSKGVLFYGPPGCGKTLLAKAIAHECNANFISIKGPELLTMWFGESEANVRELFDKARAAAPCILFFDEIDSIAKTRGGPGGGSSSGSEAADRVINQILTEIDGVNVKKPIFIIAATNRPDILDPAICRPGRLDQLIYISLPDLKSRESIFKAALKNSPLAPDVNIRRMAEELEGYSGADIAEICHRAAREAIRESIEHEIKRGRRLKEGEEDPVPYITNEHFRVAMANARKSVRKEDIKRYEQFKKKLASSTG